MCLSNLFRRLFPMETKSTKEEAYVLYQRLVDEVFGANTIVIKPAPSNNVIGTLCYLEEYKEFKRNFKARLIRLRDKFKDTASYNDLKEQVKQIADPNNWEGAYAELVAYDVMYNDYLVGTIELNKTLPANESYAKDLGRKATNEDGYIDEYDLYFDVKILSDTIGSILKGIITEAIDKSQQSAKCDILPEYPLDEDDEDYSTNRGQLCQELTTFLEKHQTQFSGTKSFTSTILPQLRYRIMWGGGVNSAMSSYDPYRHAEETRNLIFKRYTKKIMKSTSFMLLLVNFPWYNGKINSFINANQIYYRSLARRTFCGYMHDQTTKMSQIVPKFTGPETVFEVSQHITGLIFIDDNSINEENYSCHVFMNPNALHPKPLMNSYLISLVGDGNERGLFDDLMHDNY